MPKFGPIACHDLIPNLKRLGFEGPFPGGKHEFLVKGELKVRIPNPHQGDIGRELLARILRQARIAGTHFATGANCWHAFCDRHKFRARSGKMSNKNA